MAALFPDMSMQQFQLFTRHVYEIPNNRHFEIGEMLNNIQRFGMRGLKGIRKGDIEKTKKNLMISFSWFVSVLVRLRIDLEEEVWKRFPYVCSYCGGCPCGCKAIRPDARYPVEMDAKKRPKTFAQFQSMFNRIYPASKRSLDHAGVHFAEEMGEFSEAIWAYRSDRCSRDFEEIGGEVADYFSCLIGVFNSLNLDIAIELAKLYSNNCFECLQAPCMCTYETIKRYKS